MCNKCTSLLLPMTCRAPPGYVCVSGLPFKIAVPESSAILVPGTTTDALNGTRGVPASQVAVSQNNYTVVNTSSGRAIVKSLRALTSGQFGNAVFNGTFSLPSGSSIIGLPTSTNLSDAGTSADGESIISTATPPTFKSLTFSSNAFTASSSATDVRLTLKTNPILQNYTSTGTITVSGPFTLSNLAVSGAINVPGAINVTGPNITGLDVTKLISQTKAKGSLLTRNSTTAVAVTPSFPSQNGFMLTAQSANNPALSFTSIVPRTLTGFIPTIASVQAGNLVRTASVSPVTVDKVAVTDGFFMYDPASQSFSTGPVNTRYRSASLTSADFQTSPLRGVVCTGTGTISQSGTLHATEFVTNLPITIPAQSKLFSATLPNSTDMQFAADDIVSDGPLATPNTFTDASRYNRYQYGHALSVGNTYFFSAQLIGLSDSSSQQFAFSGPSAFYQPQSGDGFQRVAMLANGVPVRVSATTSTTIRKSVSTSWGNTGATVPAQLALVM